MLFLDEIHRMARPAEEMLYVAMEDFRVDVVVGKGPGATAIPLELAPFTLVGATTRAGLLPGPLRDRFGFTAHMDFYADEDLVAILVRSAALLDVPLHADGAREIAGRSRGTPRIANRLLRRVRDFAQVRGDGVVTRLAREPPWRCTRSTASASTGWTGPCSTRSSAASAAGRSGCPPSPSPWARRPRPSRRSASRSSCAPGCSRAPRAAGSRPPRPGSTSGSRCPPGLPWGDRRERRRPQWYTQPARRAAGGLSGR